MKYREFVENIKREVKERLKGQCDVTVKIDLRENGVLSDVLNIRALEGPSGAASVIPLRNYYKPSMRELEFEVCVETIIHHFYEESALLQKYGFGEHTVSWENIKSLVYPILLSTEKNWFLLEKLVSRPMLDLSVIYMIRIKIQEGKPPLAMRITDTLFHTWKISKEQLHQTAMENLKRETPVLIDMDTLAEAVLKGVKAAAVERVEKEKAYILSNSDWYYGTSMLLNNKYLRKISGGRSFYILPATLHELILVGDSEKLNAESMNAMAEIGNREVEREQRFQNHAYYYDAETEKIISCV